MLGKAKLPGELINWLTMTLLRALCLTECLKGTVLWNVQHIRLEKKAVRGQRTAGGKEIHDSAGFSSSYRVEWATAQTPSTHAPQRRRMNSHSCMLEARFQKLYSLWKVYHRVCTIKSHLLKNAPVHALTNLTALWKQQAKEVQPVSSHQNEGESTPWWNYHS